MILSLSSKLSYVPIPESTCGQGFYKIAYTGQMVVEKGEQIDGAIRIPRSDIKSFDVVGRVNSASGSLVFEMNDGRKFRLIDRFNANEYVIGYLVVPCPPLIGSPPSDKCWTISENNRTASTATWRHTYYAADGVPPPPNTDKSRYAGIFTMQGAVGVIRPPTAAEISNPSLLNWVAFAPSGQAIIILKYDIIKNENTGLEHPEYDAEVLYIFGEERGELIPAPCAVQTIAPCKTCPSRCITETKVETYYARKTRTSPNDIPLTMNKRQVICDTTTTAPRLTCSDELTRIKQLTAEFN